jgi:hypothetical protein
LYRAKKDVTLVGGEDSDGWAGVHARVLATAERLDG